MAVSEPSFIGKTNLRFWNVGTFVIFIVLITSFGCQSLCFCTLMGTSSDGSSSDLSIHFIMSESKGFIISRCIGRDNHYLLYSPKQYYLGRPQSCFQIKGQPSYSFSYYIFLTVSFAYSIRDRFVQVLQLDRFKQVLRLVYQVLLR